MESAIILDTSKLINDLSRKMDQMMDIAIRDKNYEAFTQLTAMYLIVLHFYDDEDSAVSHLSDVLGGSR